MSHYLETHGIELIIAYMAFATIVGSMPPLPANAGFWAKWAYALLHGAAMNWRSAMKLMKLPVDLPEIGPGERQDITNNKEQP